MADCTVRQVADRYQPALDQTGAADTIDALGQGCLCSYVVQVDRNSDGDFDDAGEDVGEDILQSTGIKAYRGRDVPRTISPVRVGALNTELNNRADDYSPGSTLEAGRPIRWSAHFASVHNLWRGELDRPEQHPERDRQSVSLRALGLLGKLKGVIVSTALYENITTDVAIGHLLDAAGWPAADRSLETGKTALEWWWLDEEDAFEALRDLVNTEGPGAAVYEGVAGDLVFHNRHHLITNTKSTYIQTTLRASGASPNIAAGFSHDRGIDHVINEARIVVKRRSAKSTEVIWSLGETLTLAADEARSFIVRRSGGDPFKSVVTPIAATDYTLTAGSVTPALDRTSGAQVTLTMTAGSSGATVSGLQVRAGPVTVDAENAVENRVDASASITKHKRRSLPAGFGPRAELAQNVAQDTVDAVVGWYKDGRQTVRAPLENVDDATLTAQLVRDVDERIRVIANSGNFSLDDEFYIFGIEQELATRNHLRTVWSCEKVNTNQYGAWGIARWDQNVWAF